MGAGALPESLNTRLSRFRRATHATQGQVFSPTHVSPSLSFSHPSCSEAAIHVFLAPSAADGSAGWSCPTPRAIGLSALSSATKAVEAWTPPRRRATRDNRSRASPPRLPHDGCWCGQIAERCEENRPPLAPFLLCTNACRRDVPCRQQRAREQIHWMARAHADPWGNIYV